MYQLENPTKFNEEWTTIFESKDSYLEHYICVSIPIGLNSFPKISSTYNWGTDDQYTHKKVLYRNGKEFLSLTFRRHYDIFYAHNEYMTKKNEIFAKRVSVDEGGTQSETYLVKSIHLVNYLKLTKQNMVFAYRSHRYSERILNEFGINEIMQEHATDRNNYFQQYKSLEAHNNHQRSRAKSFSIVFGKCVSLAP